MTLSSVMNQPRSIASCRGMLHGQQTHEQQGNVMMMILFTLFTLFCS